MFLVFLLFLVVLLVMNFFWIFKINFKKISFFLLIFLGCDKIHPFLYCFIFFICRIIFFNPFETSCRKKLAHRPAILVVTVNHEDIGLWFPIIKVFSKIRIVGSCILVSNKTDSPNQSLIK